MQQSERGAKRGAGGGVETVADAVHIRVPRSFALLVLLLLILGLVGTGMAGFWLGRRSPEEQASTGPRNHAVPAVAPGTGGAEKFRTKSGPWGELECTRTKIEIPDDYLSTRVHQSDPSRWFFKGYSVEKLSNLLSQAGLSASEKTDLLETRRWETTPGGILISPSSETILSLSPEARNAIYTVLAQSGENAAQQQAFHWRATSADEVFAGTGLSEKTLALVRKLCYRRGQQLLFADLPTVLRTLPDEQEKAHLEKALSGRTTLIARLLVSPKSDVDELVRYWGRPGGKDIRPLLEAAARVPDGASVSILFLLPSWPQARLQTYPQPNAGVAQYDCFWTAFNFFKENPDPPSNDGNLWTKKLETEYFRVDSDPRYGDLAMLLRPDGAIVHACVFLADDIVYSKNGANATAPWVLTTIPELLNDYSADLPENLKLHASYYRSRSSSVVSK